MLSMKKLKTGVGMEAISSEFIDLENYYKGTI